MAPSRREIAVLGIRDHVNRNQLNDLSPKSQGGAASEQTATMIQFAERFRAGHHPATPRRRKMDVRPVRPTDAPLVIALALDEGSHLVRSYPWPAANPVARSILQTVLLVPLPGRAWIAHDGSDVALLEMQPRQYVIGWDVTRLVTRGNSEWVLPAVVQAGVGHLQSRGVPRLFARCSPDRGSAAARIR